MSTETPSPEPTKEVSSETPSPEPTKTENKTTPDLEEEEEDEEEDEEDEEEYEEDEDADSIDQDNLKISKKEMEKNELAINQKLKVSQTGTQINIAWGKIPEADEYLVYVQYCGMKFTKKATKTLEGMDATSVVVKKINGKKLDLKKNYKIYIIAYKRVDGNAVKLGKTITAHIVGKNNKQYTNVKKVNVSQSEYSLEVGKTVKIQANTELVQKSKKELTNAHAKELRYASSNKKVVTVSKKGKVKAVGTGSCIVYVYARNGYAKAIRITVK